MTMLFSLPGLRLLLEQATGPVPSGVHDGITLWRAPKTATVHAHQFCGRHSARARPGSPTQPGRDQIQLSLAELSRSDELRLCRRCDAYLRFPFSSEVQAATAAAAALLAQDNLTLAEQAAIPAVFASALKDKDVEQWAGTALRTWAAALAHRAAAPVSAQSTTTLLTAVGVVVSELAEETIPTPVRACMPADAFQALFGASPDTLSGKVSSACGAAVLRLARIWSNAVVEAAGDTATARTVVIEQVAEVLHEEPPLFAQVTQFAADPTVAATSLVTLWCTARDVGVAALITRWEEQLAARLIPGDWHWVQFRATTDRLNRMLGVFPAFSPDSVTARASSRQWAVVPPPVLEALKAGMTLHSDRAALRGSLRPFQTVTVKDLTVLADISRDVAQNAATMTELFRTAAELAQGNTLEDAVHTALCLTS
jgi:hypothetical protein